jgi:hypothetical protein
VATLTIVSELTHNVSLWATIVECASSFAAARRNLYIPEQSLVGENTITIELGKP